MADQEEFRPFGVNLSTAGRFAGAGVLGGASAGAALVLVKMLRDLSKEHQALSEPSEEERNTITLTLPKRASSDKSEDNSRLDEKVKRKPAMSKSGTKAATTPSQIRNYNGEYSVKTANWQTLAASLMALGAGGSLGFNLVNKVYDIKKKRELDSQLGTAKQEYMDMLSNTVKDGDVKAAGIFSSDGRRGGSSFSLMDYPMGLGVLALLMGSGSTAWLTKKVLDEYNKDPENKYKPQQGAHIDRIVFQSEDGGKLPSMQRAEDQAVQVKDASAQDCMEASLAVYLDLMSGKADVLGDIKTAAALITTGHMPEDLYKMASEDYDKLVMFFKQNPELRSVVKKVVMEKHPMLRHFKWMSDMPMVSSYGDKKLYEKLDQGYGPDSNIFDALKARTPAVQLGDKMAAVKSAGLPGVLGSASGTTGGMMAGMALDRVLTKEPQAAEPEVKLSPEDQQAKVDAIVKNIQLGAKDPRALAFVQQNSEKIRNILLILAQEGKI